jgi:hypothetical protein
VDYKEDELKEYLQRNNSKPKKIMVTYDSVPKLSNLISFKDYKLFIDEGHKLLEYAGNFKPAVVYKLLDLIYHFKSFVITSATPISDDFTNEKLKQIPKIKLNWEASKFVNFKHLRINQNQLRDNIIAICVEYLRNKKIENLYIYYNSVLSITRICKDLVTKFGATSDDIKIICADTENNKKILKTIGKNFKPSKVIEPSEPNKFYKINFITSTAFEGQDFLDPDGRTYIVSDSKLEHTKLDISTQVSQIVGRLRDSKYKNEVNMIWTASPTLSITDADEYMKFLQSQKISSINYLKDFSQVSTDRAKESLIMSVKNDPFFVDLTEISDKTTQHKNFDLILNPDAINHLMNVFLGTSLQYYVNMGEKFANEIIEADVHYTLNEVFSGKIDNTLKLPELSPTDKRKLGKKTNFGKAVKEYYSAKYYIQNNELTDDQKNHFNQIITDFETNPDFECVMEYIELFGFDQELKDFSDDSIKESRIQKKIKDKKQKDILSALIKTQFSVDAIYSTNEIKNIIQNLYEKYNLNWKAKASDINLSFITKNSTKNINGKTVAAYKIEGIK